MTSKDARIRIQNLGGGQQRCHPRRESNATLRLKKRVHSTRRQGNNEAGMRLGEILLRHGLITPDELGEGLATQVTHGGRIGSNLIDLGYIAVDDVARALGKQHSVPAARDEAFRAVTSATLGAVPRDLCAKHGIFPLALDGAVLHLAMRNPQHLALIDHLGRVLNLTIQPYASAELRLLYFLELLYAIPRPKRYLATQGDGGWRGELEATVSRPPSREAQRALGRSQTTPGALRQATPAHVATAARAAAARAAAFPGPTATRVPTLTPPALPAVKASAVRAPAINAPEAVHPDAADPKRPSGSASSSTTGPQRAAAALPKVSDNEFELVYLDEVDHSIDHSDNANFDLDIDVSFDEDVLDEGGHAPSANEGSQPDITHHTGEASTPTPTATVAELVTALESAQDREAVIAQLLRPLDDGVSLTVLLLPRGDLAVGLAATGAAISRTQVRQLVVPMNTDSLFAQAIADLRPTRGPADALQHMIATYLRAPTPGEAWVTPISLHGKVINLLCTQSQTSLPEAVENDLAQIADQAAIAYKRLILQKRGDQAP
ncbi:MAG: hypothetical protein KAI47_17500 [Deltaproteobacteria bacterium]|nr:hypothetical protein [Deltaproteobacteria bacterium]